MDERITAKELKAALGVDLERLIGQVVEAVNRAEGGRIIADSEEPVRDAVGLFRQALYEKAIQLRQGRSESSFSPSPSRAAGTVGQQGPAEDQLPDGQRPGAH